ncbi:MAG: DUF6056 family protein [Alphaproteobacteria bacterium]
MARKSSMIDKIVNLHYYPYLSMKSRKYLSSDNSIVGKHWGIVFLLMVFTYMALMSYMMPVLKDDFILIGPGKLLPSWYEYWHHGIYSVKDSFYRQGGRFGFLLMPFLYKLFYRAPFEEELSEIIYAIINGAVFLSFLWGLFVVIYARKPKLSHRHDLIRIILLFCFALTLLASIFETIFWFNGRIYQLWATTILLWFLVFYRLRWADKNFLSFMEKSSKTTIKQIAFWCFFIPFAIVSGMQSEIGNVLVIILIAGIFIYKKFITNEKIPKWMWVGFLFFILGCVMMVSPPGFYYRFQNDPVTQTYHTLPFLGKYIIHPLKGALIFILGTKLLPIIALLVLGYWYKTIPVRGKNFSNGLIKKIEHNRSFGFALLLFMLTLLYIAGMGLNPAQYARTWFVGSVIFLLCFMVIIDYFFLSPNRLFFLKKTYFGKTISQYLFSLISGGFIIYLVWMFAFMVDFRQAVDQNIQSLLEQKTMGKTTIILKKIPDKYNFVNRHITYGIKSAVSPYYISVDIAGMNWVMARYYGVKKIIFVQDN